MYFRCFLTGQPMFLSIPLLQDSMVWSGGPSNCVTRKYFHMAGSLPSLRMLSNSIRPLKTLREDFFRSIAFLSLMRIKRILYKLRWKSSLNVEWSICPPNCTICTSPGEIPLMKGRVLGNLYWHSNARVTHKNLLFFNSASIAESNLVLDTQERKNGVLVFERGIYATYPR